MKILIIGLGSVGEKHVKSIKSLNPLANILALRSKREAENFPGIKNVYALDDIESGSIDFAIIANPTSEHKKTITQLLDFDLPIFIEKPVCFSLDIEETVNLAVSRGIHTYVACNLRFLDSIKFIKNMIPLITNKRLNEVNIYCGSFLPDWRPNIDFRKSYSANVELGGGIHLDLIHELDYLYWLFGMPKEVIRNFRSQSSLEITSIDYANYMLDYNSFCANIVLNYYRRDPKRSLELVFDDETWNVDLLKNQVTCKDRLLYSSEQSIGDTYISQMKYFINCITQNENTFNTISDAYNVLKICLGENDTKR